MKKTLTVTETVTYSFEIDTENPPFDLATMETDNDTAEEWFCALDNPNLNADQVAVTEREFSMEEAE